MNQPKKTQLIIFAKYPEAGKVKTRLAPKLGFDGAAKLAEKLLAHTLEQALGLIKRNESITVNLCVSPTPDADNWQAFKTELEAKHPLAKHILWTAQADGDLGERLTAASKDAITNNASPVFIGTDCPALTADKLAHAINQLTTHDSVIVPAQDGGYVLFGFHSFDTSLFQDIAWSTETVAKDTLERIDALGWSVSKLPTEHDIDYPEDLIHLPCSISVEMPVQ